MEYKEKYGLMRIIRYVNSSYIKDFEAKDSIFKYCLFFDKAIVIWYSKK